MSMNMAELRAFFQWICPKSGPAGPAGQDSGSTVPAGRVDENRSGCGPATTLAAGRQYQGLTLSYSCKNRRIVDLTPVGSPP